VAVEKQLSDAPLAPMNTIPVIEINEIQ